MPARALTGGPVTCGRMRPTRPAGTEDGQPGPWRLLLPMARRDFSQLPNPWRR